MKRAIIILACALTLTACGRSVSGVYKGQKDAVFNQIAFSSDDKVSVTFGGSVVVGTFKVDGDKVDVTVNGDTREFMKDDNGCLEGGPLIGTYCQS